MKKVEVSVYAIDELKGKAKEKAIGKIKDNLIELNFEDFFENSRSYIKDELGIDGQVYYSLSYSQGDGLRIETTFFNTDKVIDMLQLDESTKATIKKLSNDGDLIVATKSNNRKTFYSENDCLVEFSEEVENLLPGYMLENINQAFVDVYMKICGDLQKQGYDCYEVSDNDCIEYANDNDLLYFANGDIFHE